MEDERDIYAMVAFNVMSISENRLVSKHVALVNVTRNGLNTESVVSFAYNIVVDRLINKYYMDMEHTTLVYTGMLWNAEDYSFAV